MQELGNEAVNRVLEGYGAATKASLAAMRKTRLMQKLDLSKVSSSESGKKRKMQVKQFFSRSI